MKEMSLFSFKFERLELKFVRKSKYGNEYGILSDKIEEERKKFNLKAKEMQSHLKVKKNDVKERLEIVNDLREHEELITELESLSVEIVEINNVCEYCGGNNKCDDTKNNISKILESLGKEDGNSSASNILSEIKKARSDFVKINNELSSEVKKKNEIELKEFFSKLSLYDIYDQLEEKLTQLTGVENNKGYLRDGDCHLFHQLLIEDSQNDSQNDKSCLKMIDLVLPSQIEDGDYKSFRPFMINMPRHMLEQSSQMMEMVKIESNESQEKADEVTQKLCHILDTEMDE